MRLTLFARERGISTRILHCYMAIATAVDDGTLDICNDRCKLSLRQALAFIAKVRKEKKPATPDRHPAPVIQDRDTCALGELAQLEACWAQFLTLLDAVERVVRLRSLKNTAGSSPSREVAS
jgi:hypothetical protein